MEEDEYSEENNEDETKDLLEKTKSASPRQKELLKKQAEFELSQKDREVEEIKEGRKKSKLEIFFTWAILVLVAVGLIFLANWLLF